MSCKIGRLVSLGIGKETTAGTEASSFTWIPLTVSPFIKPIVEYINDENGIGRIEGSKGQELIKEETETTVEGWVGQQTFGNILTATFGQSVAPVLIETGVYKHNFTVLNSNDHKSFSIVTDGDTQDLSLYNMIDTLDLTAEVGNVLTFSSMFKGKAVNTTTGKTVAFVSEQYFKVANMTAKFASNIAGLTGATAVPLQTINLSFAKNVLPIYKVGSLEPAEICNQQMDVTGDFEAMFDDDTYKDYVTGNTNRAMRITIQGDFLIGATKKAELNFDFAYLNFTEWDRSTDNNNVLTQTVGFSGGYSVADSQMVTAYLQNTQSTQY